MIGRMTCAFGADDVACLRLTSRKVRFQMIADTTTGNKPGRNDPGSHRRLALLGSPGLLSLIYARLPKAHTGLLPFRPQRARPYLYSELEIQKLLAAALKLSPNQGLRPRTYHCLFGLLAVAGLRISEVLKLERPDVDLGEGILTIRQTKFGKTRLVPLHTSTRDVMADYARHRDRFLRNASGPCFFLNDHGRRLDDSTVRRTFYELSRQIGLRGPADHKGPRLHDFRHRFAVRTLVEWYRSNEDIERRLPVLSTFLGHGHVADTYWYISVEPELMGLATRRLELRWGLTHEE